MNRRVLIYGATGFSGRLVLEQLVRSGHDLILAGRTAQTLHALGLRMNLPVRHFDLSDPAAIATGVSGVDVVLHAAGPFIATAEPMMRACLAAGVHYLDLAGEWPVFALAQRLGPQASAVGTMLMPGIGFAIVASDCLLAYASRHTTDTSLFRIALSRPDIVSRGSLRTMLGLTDSRVIVRRAGTIHRVSVGRLERRFDFGEGERTCMAVNWPDVITAQHTTGVGSIEAYAETGWMERAVYQGASLAASAAGPEVVREVLRPLSRAWPALPQSARPNAVGHSLVVEAVDPWRRVTRFGLRTADGYSVTARTASAIVNRVVAGEFEPGFQTPAGRFGADLLETLDIARPFASEAHHAAVH